MAEDAEIVAINKRAYDWVANNFGDASFNDISWSFDQLGDGHFFDSYTSDNFTSVDTLSNFNYSEVSGVSAPTLSGVSAASSPTFADVAIGSATYTDQGIASPEFTEYIIAGEH